MRSLAQLLSRRLAALLLTQSVWVALQVQVLAEKGYEGTLLLLYSHASAVAVNKGPGHRVDCWPSEWQVQVPADMSPEDTLLIRGCVCSHASAGASLQAPRGNLAEIWPRLCGHPSAGAS